LRHTLFISAVAAHSQVGTVGASPLMLVPTGGLGEGLPARALLGKGRFLRRPLSALKVLGISHKVYKAPSLCTIVRIGYIQSIRNNRNMAKPEISFKVGAVRASVFRNLVANNGKMVPLPKVVIEVRYKDKSGQWNGTNSLSLNDIPKAILALQKAFEYLTQHKEPGTQEDAYTGPQ
jgi:hypothetical protein